MSRLIAEGKTVSPGEIVVRDRLRPVSEAGVAAVMESVRTLGRLTDPIQVRLIGRGDKKSYELMAGAHRLEAAIRLGHKKIRATVWECNNDEAVLFEVDDNLARAELSVLELAVFMARHQEAYLRLHPESARGGNRGNQHTGGRQTEIISFSQVVAEKRGISERHVRNLVAAGRRLKPETITALQAPATGVKVDLKTIMDLAKMEAGQADAAALIARGEARRVREAVERLKGLGPKPKAPVEDAFAALIDRFERAPMAAKRAFLAELWARHGDLIEQERFTATGGPAS